MAAWLAKDPKTKKSCDKCIMFKDPTAFEAGAQVLVAGAGDCEKCIVRLSQPSADNELILEAYGLLPSNYEGWTGYKVVRYEEVMEIFRMLKLPELYFDDYYKRLMFLHEQLIKFLGLEREKASSRHGEDDLKKLSG